MPGHAFEGFVLVDNDTEEIATGPDAGSSILTRITTGAYLHGALDGIDYEFELIYQGGAQATPDTSALIDVEAYLVSGAIGHTFSTSPRLHAGIHYTVLSGDKNASDDESNGFNTLFATNHKFYGLMDYFPAMLPQRGLKDFGISMALSPIEPLNFQLEAHHFSMAGAILESEVDVYGVEVDFTTSYAYNQHFSLQGGLSVFFPGEVMKALRGDQTASWFYLMSTVNF